MGMTIEEERNAYRRALSAVISYHSRNGGGEAVEYKAAMAALPPDWKKQHKQYRDEAQMRWAEIYRKETGLTAWA